MNEDITGKEEKHGYHTDRYFSSRRPRRIAHLASQQELGILSQRVLLILIILLLMGRI